MPIDDMKDRDYGLLLGKDIKLHRMWFREMCRLIGVNVQYRACLPGKTWTRYSEIESNYQKPITIGCIFDEHPVQKTMKKLGWVSELQDGESIIHVSYDTPDIQVGNLVVIPSGIDNASGRMFRIVEVFNIMIYPASVACKVVPEYEDNFEPDLYDHSTNSFNLLNEDGDGNL